MKTQDFLIISAKAAIEGENGEFLSGQRIMVKAAEMKSQKQKAQNYENKDGSTYKEDEPMNKSKTISLLKKLIS